MRISEKTLIINERFKIYALNLLRRYHTKQKIVDVFSELIVKVKPKGK